MSTSATGSLNEGDPIDAIVEEALERLRRGERPTVEEYASKHPELAEALRVTWRALVIMENLNGSSLDETRLCAGRQAADDTPPPEVLGDYRLLREIGRGGMGVVYEAEQVSLGRRVALKVLPRDMTGDATRLQRFEREARAAGRLHHTNIVPVFGVGHHDGTHFYIMQLIQGVGLEAVIRELRRLRGGQGSSHRLEVSTIAASMVTGRFARAVSQTRDHQSLTSEDFSLHLEPEPVSTGAGTATSRPWGTVDPSTLSSLGDFGVSYWDNVARIGKQAAEALQYAHDQKILHRDIKPSNLLLDLHGTVWLTDFGLAKALDEDQGFTRSHDVLGTLRYMAPERFEGRCDERGDIYALGLTLYELLVLRPAFQAKDVHALIHQATHSEPSRLRDLDRNIPRDLHTIVHKAIAREPERRYASATELAEDLENFRARRPIRARRLSQLARFQLWCQRNPALAASNIAAAVLTTTVAIVSSVAAVRLNDSAGSLTAALANQTTATRKAVAEAQRAEAAESAALHREYDALVSEARASRFSGRTGQRLGTLKAVREANILLPRLGLSAEEVVGRRSVLRDLAVAALALADLEQTPWPDYPGIRDDWDAYAVSRDLTLRVRADRDNGTLVVTRAADDSEVARLPGDGLPRRWLRFSPDNRFVHFSNKEHVGIWAIGETQARDVLCPVPAHTEVFSPDSRFLYVLSSQAGVISRVDTATGTVSMSYAVRPLPQNACNLAISPDGNRLAFATGAYMSPESRIVRILDLETGTIAMEIPFGDGVRSLAWSPSGGFLAAGATNLGDFAVWDLSKSPPVRVESPFVNPEPNVILAFNASESMLACVGNWRTSGLNVYEPDTRRLLLRVPGFTLFETADRLQGPYAGDRIVATVPVGNTLTQQEIIPGSAFRCLKWRNSNRDEQVLHVSIHRNNRLAACGTIGGGTVLWDLSTGRRVGGLPTGGNVWFQPDGRALWTSDQVSGKQRWPIRDDSGALALGPPVRVDSIGGEDHPVRTSGDGRIVALVPDFNSGVVVFPLDEPERAFRLADGIDVRRLSVSPDGRYVLTRQHTMGSVQLWDTATGTALRTIEPGDPSGSAEIWRLWGVTAAAHRPGGAGPFDAMFLTWSEVGFPADQSLAFHRQAPGRITIWDVPTGRELVHLDAPLEEAYGCVAVSPDGASVLLGPGSEQPGGARLWDLRSVRKELAAMGLDWDAPALPDLPAESDPRRPLRVEVIPGPVQDSGIEGRWMLGITDRKLADDPDDAEAHHRRGLALLGLFRFEDAETSFDRSLAIRPEEPRTLLARARARAMRGQPEAAETDERQALALLETRGDLRPRLALRLNNRAWHLVASREATSVQVRLGLIQARQALRLESSAGAASQTTLNTLGVALYRANQDAEAVDVLTRGRAANQGFDAFDLFFLAMARHRLGDVAGGRAAFDQAVSWVRDHGATLEARYRDELATFRAEAETALAIPAGPRDDPDRAEATAEAVP